MKFQPPRIEHFQNRRKLRIAMETLGSGLASCLLRRPDPSVTQRHRHKWFKIAVDAGDFFELMESDPIDAVGRSAVMK
jgi:hypothetical protein